MKRVQQVFGEQNGQRIECFQMPICTVDNDTSYTFPALFSKISLIFPYLKKLEVYVELADLNVCYDSIEILISEMSSKFPLLVHLRLRMYLRDEK